MQYDFSAFRLPPLSTAYRGSAAGDVAVAPGGYVALSGVKHPSPVMAALAEGVSSGIGSQIAVKLTLDTVASELGAIAEEKEALNADESLRRIFKTANVEVYEYGHRMAAGGQIASRAIVGVFDGSSLCVGQVGEASAYLVRAGRVNPFFKPRERTLDMSGGVLDRFVGANSKILIDLASIELLPGDAALLTTLPETKVLLEVLESVSAGEVRAADLCRNFVEEIHQRLLEGESSDSVEISAERQALLREGRNIMVVAFTVEA